MNVPVACHWLVRFFSRCLLKIRSRLRIDKSSKAIAQKLKEEVARADNELFWDLDLQLEGPPSQQFSARYSRQVYSRVANQLDNRLRAQIVKDLQ